MDTLSSALLQKIVDKLNLYPETLCAVAQCLRTSTGV